MATSAASAVPPAEAPPGRKEEEVEQVEQLLLTIREVFVYSVPPLRSSSGYRAEEWDLPNPLITGVLRVYQQDELLVLRLFEPKRKQDDVMVLGIADMDLELFAECPIRLDESKGKTLNTFFDHVVDSSRYFVVRCQDRNSKRHAYVGIGFRDRQAAFDLKATLQDFLRYTERAQAVVKLQAKGAASSTAGVPTADGGQDSEEQEGGAAPPLEAGTTPAVPQVDLRLKEGEKIKLNLKAFVRPHRGTAPPLHDHDGSARPLGLPPPPSSSLKPPPPTGAALSPCPPAQQHYAPLGQQQVEDAQDDDEVDEKQGGAAAATVATTTGEDDWGDFTSG